VPARATTIEDRAYQLRYRRRLAPRAEVGSDSGPIATCEINKNKINTQTWEEKGMSPSCTGSRRSESESLTCTIAPKGETRNKTKAAQNKTKQNKNGSSTICINDYGAQATILYKHKKKKEHIVGVGDDGDDWTMDNEAMNKSR
jgi:hypothetical protein